jgi:DNA-binding transcriptional LysR family regulator
LSQLEAALGVILFERSTRSLVLTEAGALYLEGVRPILRSLEEADAAVRSRGPDVRGPLRVNAPMMFGMARLVSILPRFMELHPQVALDIRLDDRLNEDPTALADVTLRIAAMPAEDHATATLCTVERHVCAAPSYLERRSAPAAPGDIANHDCLHYGNLASGSEWVLHKHGASERVEVRGRLVSNNGAVLLEAALAGHGLTILPDFVAQPYLEAGRLIRALPDWQPSNIHAFAIMPFLHRQDPRIRAFVAFLQDGLRPQVSRG